MKRIIHNFHTVNKNRTTYAYLPFILLWMVFILMGVKGYSQPCSVIAGEEQEICANVTLVLSGQATGNLLGAGNILWEQVDGPIANIANPNSLVTDVFGLIGGEDYTFKLSATCQNSEVVSDEVDITVLPITISDAGEDQSYCDGTTQINLIGTAGSEGIWSFVSKPDGNADPVILSTPDNTATASNLSPGSGSFGDYVFRYTISDDDCTSFDEMTVRLYNTPSLANAGPDQELCNTSSLTLAANTPSAGTGLWSFVSGPNDPVITNPASPNNTVTGVIAGTYVYRWSITNGPLCTPSTDDVSITIRPEINITGLTDASFCSGGQHEFNAVATGSTGSFNYQWQFNNGGTWENVGTNSSSYTTPALVDLGDNQYRVLVSDQVSADDGNCQTTSSTATITVSGGAEITTQPTALTTICQGGNTTLGVVASLPSGASQLIYQWQISVSNSPYNWVNITGATNSTFTTAIQTQTRYYRVLIDVENSDCPTESSSVAVVRMNNVTPGSIGSDQTICSGTSPATLTSVTGATGDGVITYQWQNSSNGSDFVNITGANSPTYAPGNLTADTWYRRIAISTLNGVACTSTSNAIKITVTTPPVVNDPGDFVFCNGAASGTITLSGTPSGLTFNWTNNNTTIGLAASGSGNIGSFTATNATNAPITATITVTAEVEQDSDCNSDPITFTITVNPTPVVNAVSNQQYCDGETTNAITFTGNVTGTIYTWTNSHPSIGLAASGTGSIPPFQAVNSGTGPVTATITVTPVFTNAGVECIGTPREFTITVYNIPSEPNAGPDQSLCAVTSTTLNGSIPTSPATGKWTQIGGPSTLVFADDTQYNTTVSGLVPGAPSVYELKWTHSIGSSDCDSDDTMTISVWAQPSTANAGPDQILCNVPSLTLAANTPTVGTGTWTRVSGPNVPVITNPNSPNTTVTGVIAGTYVFRWSITHGTVCTPSTDDVTITIRPPINISGVTSSSVCSGGAHEFNAIATGGSGSFNYQWQFNDNDTWGNVGANSSSYTTPELDEVGIYQYRVRVSDQVPADNGGCLTTSVAATITVGGGAEITTQPTALTTLCQGGITTLGVVAVLPSGASQLLYQWQISVSNSPYNWANITGATNPTFTTAIQIQTRYYRVLINVQDSDCPTESSSVAVVRMNNVTPGSIGSNQTICSGTSPAPLTSVTGATGEGVITYQWQNSLNGSDFVNIIGATSPTYAPGNLTADTWYRRIAISTLNGVACNSISNSIKITVTTPPVVNDPGDFVFCNGASTGTITLSGTPSGLTFNWTNNNTTIGLAASGSGNIGSFTATNTTNAPITATITVTAEVDPDSSCNSDPITFTITVNPTPVVNAVSNQQYCNGATTSVIPFTGNVAGTIYTWTNSNTSIGLAASGTGSIPPFQAVNNGTGPVTATINVTPAFTNAGVECIGTPREFTITVNTFPSITSPSTLTICNGSSVNYSITSNIAGTTYTWTAALQSGTATGFSNGSGNTINQVLSNTSNSPAVVRYTITPTGPQPSECAGTPFILNVTVNPTPIVIAVAEEESICGGSDVEIALSTSTTGATLTYSWTAALLSGTAGGFSNGTGNSIIQTLTNTTNQPAVVRYTITPAIGTCVGNAVVKDIVVNPSAQVNLPQNQRHCANAQVPATVFTTNRTVGVTSYTWTNSNINIGLGASGSGNLPAFTATNNTLAPITATIQVTPQYTNEGSTCSGAPVTFTITINPKGQVNKPDNKTVCKGEPVVVNFNSNNTGGTTTFTWTNSNTNIGLPSSGSGNISYTAANPTNTPITATINVTPIYSNGGVTCTGDPQTFTITVMPAAQVNKPANVSVCNESNTTAINLGTNNTGGVTTYAWTNNNPSIGLAASGTGNIPAFYASITGTNPVVATIRVTPTFTMGAFSCEGDPVEFTITVNPRPVVTSAATLTICDKTAMNYTPTANISGTTFTWTASVISGSASGFSPSGTGTITDAITNTQASNVTSVVRYVITPIGPTGCFGPVRNLDVSVRKCADLAITKTDGSTQYNPGTTVAYTVVVRNNGPSNAFGVTVADTAPAGTTISSWSVVFAGGTTGSASGTGNLNEIINIPNNATATYTINVAVPSSFTGNLVNTATVSVPAGILDDNLANNTATDTSAQANVADLRLVKTGSPNPVVAGENITYTITLTNDGPSNALNVQVQDVLPSSLTFVSSTRSRGTWSAPVWTIGLLEAGETVSMTLVATVNSNAASSISNTASATSNTTDPNANNNSDTETTTVIRSSDLAISKTSSPKPVTAGETLTYTIVVSNNGPSNAVNVSVKDELPAELSYLSATASVGIWNTDTDTWNIGNLAVGSQATLTLATTVNSNVTSSIVNTATVSSLTPDPNPNNNTATETTTVSRNADLSITKVANSNTVVAGENVTYTLTVKNNGPSDASGVAVNDVLPAQLQLVNATTNTGTWTAPVWSIGTLASGQEVTLTLVARVNANATGTISNTATVSSSTTDPNLANNTATHVLTVSASTVLSINKTGPAEISAGARITYSLVIANLGPSNAVNVLVTDNLPATLTNPEYSIDGGNNWFTWNGTYTRASLAAGANFEVQLRANTPPNMNSGQTIINTASVSSPTAGASAQNSHTTTVRTSADLAILKTRAAGVVLAGGNIVYTLRVTNLGPSNAQNVVVTDILPSNLTFVSASPQQGTWLQPNWTIGTLPAGSNTTMELIVKVNPEVADGTLIVNEASVASSTSDPNPANNKDVLGVSVNTEADLSVIKSVNIATPDVGTNVVFTIAVTNLGPSRATGVRVTEQLPDGYTYVSHSGGTYTPANDTWTIGDLSISNTAQLRITARVNASGNYTNTAIVDGAEDDPDPDNNIASVTTTPRPVADVSVEKSSNLAFQSVGQNVVFTIKAINNGPSIATNVQVVDNLPAGFTFQSAITTAGTYNNNTGLWSVGNLNAGSSVNLEIIATVNAIGPYTNSASITTAVFDPVAGNNSNAATISVILAVNDNFSNNPINGYIGGTAGNVLLNDLLQGLPVTAGLINISLIDNDGLAGLVINASGAMIVPPGTPAGVYSAVYQICEKALPGNCDIAEVTIVVIAPLIEAVNDNFTSSPVIGLVGGIAGNVLANDKLNNNPVIANQVSITITQDGGLDGVTINQAGSVIIPAGVPAGSYVISYQICEVLNPNNCDAAQVTILVIAADIVAEDDDFTGIPVDGINGGIAGNVLDNDLLNELPVSSNDINISLLDNDGIAELAIDEQGQVIIPPTTTAGQYVISYRICEVLNPENCDDAQVVILVSAASIIAGNDAFGPVNGYTGSANAGNVLTNDRLNGEAVDINEITLSIVSIHERLTLDINTGILGVLPSTPAGTYELEYEICEILNPDNCNAAQAIVEVVAAPIIAINDNFGPVSGLPGFPNLGNILANDMLNGVEVVMDEISLSILSMDDQLTLDIATGAVGVLPGTASGSYFIEYEICEYLNPTNCDDALVTVLVGSSTIIANDDSFGPVNGYTGNPDMGNVLSNDIVNGVEATIDKVIISIVSSESELIALDTSSGIIGIEPGFAAGTYLLEYRICEILNPSNCDLATVSVIVEAPSIVTNDDNFGPFDGIIGTTEAGNVLANDLISGQVVDASDVTLSIISSDFIEGIALDITTGIVTIAPLTTGGTYNMVYQICDVLNPENCDQANVTVIINPFADLSILKTADNIDTVVDSEVTFTLLITNNGPNDASEVVVIDQLTSGFTYVSDNTEGAWDPETGIWEIGDLESGASVSMEILVLVNEDGDLYNLATVSGAQPDPNIGNNTSIINLDPDALADLSIDKTVDNLVAEVNSTVVFSLTASNLGPGIGFDVLVTDMLPDGFSYLSHTGNGTYIPESGLWTIGSIQIGQTATLEISANVNPTGNYTNVATISGSAEDPDLTNNSDEVTVIAVPVADLAISKTVNQEVAPEGSQVVFTLTVNNNGPSTATGVEVLDLLPSGYTFDSVNGEGAYNPENGIWTIGTIENGAFATLEITVLVNSDGEYTNIAEVYSETIDPDESNNSDSATIVTSVETDLGIVKSSNRDRASVDSDVVFYITVTNHGPSNATGVQVLDLLPDGYTYSDHISIGDYNPVTGEWLIGDLANQASETLEISARIRSEGNYTNVATVTGNEFDPVSENNTDSKTIIIDRALVIPEGFSPNDDGFNDRFVVFGLEQYPNNRIIIVNRWGNKVFEASPYNNDWDGTNMFGVTLGGRDLPEGTYFYIIELREAGMDPLKGFIYIKR